MQYSVNWKESIRSLSDDTRTILKTIAGRHIGANPPLPPNFHPISTDGFRWEDGRADIDLTEKLPDACLMQYAYAAGLIWAGPEAHAALFEINCYSPVNLYVNGKLTFDSGIVEETQPKRVTPLKLPLHPGWNLLLLEFRKVRTGFGCRIGSNNPDWQTHHVMSPFPEREGHAGWIYSEAVDAPLFGEDRVPDHELSEALTGVAWHPRTDWSEEEQSQGWGARMFGETEGNYAYAWTKIRGRSEHGSEVRFAGEALGPVRIWIEGKPVHEQQEGVIDFRCSVPSKAGQVLVESVRGPGGWGFTLFALEPEIAFMLPVPVQGAADPWLYIGALEQSLIEQGEEPEAITNSKRVFLTGTGATYWRIDRPNHYIRPYVPHHSLFGKWNYPLGVTTYGILKSGAALNDETMLGYARQHLEFCSEWFPYSIWDRDTYGFPGINKVLSDLEQPHQVCMAATVFAAHERFPNPATMVLGEAVMDYLYNRCTRQPAGIQYRLNENRWDEYTIWADDVHMGLPCLYQYARVTGDTSHLDAAVDQFLLFVDYLRMPGECFSHIYSILFKTQNGIQWGRGNGWIVFTLAELLREMPSDHVRRPRMLALYKEVCAELLELQNASGMWHQVLNDPHSYEEVSCTSMFMYAYGEGIRQGWLDDPAPYATAIRSGWDAISTRFIDQNGNVYGVCRGSLYSYDPDYYKNVLLWTINDIHGIGIVLIAGVEAMILEEGC